MNHYWMLFSILLLFSFIYHLALLLLLFLCNQLLSLLFFMMFLFLNNFIGFLYQINQIGLLQQMSQLFELSLLERSDFLWLFNVDLSLLRVDLIDESLHFVLKWFIFLIYDKKVLKWVVRFLCFYWHAWQR